MILALWLATACMALSACGSPSFMPITAPNYANHPYFPIGTGALHAGIVCTDCHGTNNDSFKIIACTTCHAVHSQTATDPLHVAAVGYVYSSPHCLSCHPNSLHR